MATTTYANCVPESKVRRKTKPAYTPPPTTAARNLPPSPPWVGWTIVVLLLLAIVWIVSYTLGPAPFQGRLGNWNFAIAIGLAIAGVGMLTRWR
jgi:hypothetical protein